MPGGVARLEHKSWVQASVEPHDGVLGGITAPWCTEGPDQELCGIDK